MPFANPASVQERTDLKSVKKVVNFAFNMNVRLCIGSNFDIFHLSPFSLVLI